MPLKIYKRFKRCHSMMQNESLFGVLFVPKRSLAFNQDQEVLHLQSRHYCDMITIFFMQIIRLKHLWPCNRIYFWSQYVHQIIINNMLLFCTFSINQHHLTAVMFLFRITNFSDNLLSFWNSELFTIDTNKVFSVRIDKIQSTLLQPYDGISLLWSFTKIWRRATIHA